MAKTTPKNYIENIEYLSASYDEVDGESFYKFLFPNCEASGDLYDDFSHPNAIYLYKDKNSEKEALTRRIMLSDTWSDDFINNIEGNFLSLCGGLTYRGRSNRLEHAQQMNALVFDLDGVGFKEMRNLFLRFTLEPSHLRSLLTPTFIVCSGYGIHLYYVFDEPIDLYPNIKLQLKSLKHDLTFKMWDYKATSQQKAIQYQSINQTFRMVGSVNSKYGVTVRAFRTGDKVSLAELNKYPDHEENRVDLNKPFRPSQMTRAEAKEKYPEWYERVVVKHSKAPKKWDIAGKVHGNNPYALYDWWRRKSPAILGGHRYFYLFCMAVYGCKCDVPKAKLKADMQEKFEELKKVEHENPLTQADVDAALEGYNKEYYNFTIKDIELLCDVHIERNKRKPHSNQAEHLEEARAIRDIRQRRKGTKWTDNNGRPKGSGSAWQTVWEYRCEHPEAKPKDCITETGLSKNTVYKWWNEGSPVIKADMEGLTVTEYAEKYGIIPCDEAELKELEALED